MARALSQIPAHTGPRGLVLRGHPTSTRRWGEGVAAARLARHLALTHSAPHAECGNAAGLNTAQARARPRCGAAAGSRTSL